MRRTNQREPWLLALLMWLYAWGKIYAFPAGHLFDSCFYFLGPLVIYRLLAYQQELPFLSLDHLLVLSHVLLLGKSVYYCSIIHFLRYAVLSESLMGRAELGHSYRVLSGFCHIASLVSPVCAPVSISVDLLGRSPLLSNVSPGQKNT